jgi:hypothetical protein
MSAPRKDPSVRRTARASRHPAIVARRRLRRRIILGVLAAMLVAPLFMNFGGNKKPLAQAPAGSASSAAPAEPGIAPLPAAVQPVTRERLIERVDSR